MRDRNVFINRVKDANYNSTHKKYVKKDNFVLTNETEEDIMITSADI